MPLAIRLTHASLPMYLFINSRIDFSCKKQQQKLIKLLTQKKCFLSWKDSCKGVYVICISKAENIIVATLAAQLLYLTFENTRNILMDRNLFSDREGEVVYVPKRSRFTKTLNLSVLSFPPSPLFPLIYHSPLSPPLLPSLPLSVFST